MKKNNYFENVFDNVLNHCMIATGNKHYSEQSVASLADKIYAKHLPRGKCYNKMHNQYWTRQK